jgi:hypothetical protein
MSLCSNIVFSLAIDENQFGKGGEVSIFFLEVQE